MKSNKIIIFIIAIMVVFLVIMLFVFKKDGNNSSSLYKILIVDNFNVKYDNGVWKKVDKSTVKDLNLKFHTYVNSEYLGIYNLEKGTYWNIFDDEGNFINYDGTLLAYNEGFNIKIHNYIENTLNEDDKEYLKEKYNISSFSNLVTNMRCKLDIDNNGQEDEIILLSSANDISSSYENSYNLFLVIMNNKIIKIIDEKGINVNKIYNLKAVIDIDKVPSVVIESVESYASDNPTIDYDIYKYKNNKFRKVVYN